MAKVPFLLSLLAQLLASSLNCCCQNVPICAVAENATHELKKFPLYYNARHIMNIYFRYVGTSPEDSESRGAKGVPEKFKIRRVDYYHYEIENLTDLDMLVYEIVLGTNTFYQDKDGQMHQTAPTTLNSEDILRAWGDKDAFIAARERQIMQDFWRCCPRDEPSCSDTTTFKIEILSTGERFAFQIVRHAPAS